MIFGESVGLKAHENNANHKPGFSPGHRVLVQT